MMDMMMLAKFVFAFIFVISLMLMLGWALKRMGLPGTAQNRGPRRLKIIEALPLDHRRRLMLVQRDNVQHLLVLSATGEILVESNIAPLEEPAHAPI
jgi:flagellar protein FliO/FliZ